MNKEELVSIINNMGNKLEKYKLDFDFFEDSEQLLEDYEEAVAMARLIYLSLSKELEAGEPNE